MKDNGPLTGMTILCLLAMSKCGYKQVTIGGLRRENFELKKQLCQHIKQDRMIVVKIDKDAEWPTIPTNANASATNSAPTADSL